MNDDIQIIASIVIGALLILSTVIGLVSWDTQNYNAQLIECAKANELVKCKAVMKR